MLLHGPPGVGKTTTVGQYHFKTANGVLDPMSKQRRHHRRRSTSVQEAPIADKLWSVYHLSTPHGRQCPTRLLNLEDLIGDVGTRPAEVEDFLNTIFTLAIRWDCVLLLQESDVFLSARETHDFVRSGLVAG
jgi:DNA polymerase III delta prime subunit